MREMVVLQEMRGGDERNGGFAEEEDRTWDGVRERAVG
jgi:hypothetical protein